MIISSTPFRISFLGGGSDFPEWYRENGGAVLAMAIDKYCYISVRYLPPFFDHKYRVAYSKVETVNDVSAIQHPVIRETLRDLGDDSGLEIHHDADLPARAGLGSSSAFAVGFLHAVLALRGRMASKEFLAREAIRIERELLNETVGCQDQITVSHGGFNHIRFDTSGAYNVSPVTVSAERLQELQDHLMLFFTGFRRSASDIERDKLNNYRQRTAELRTMQAMVDDALAILTNGRTSLMEFGALVHEGWKLKRSLSDRVATPDIDDIYQTARTAGAVGGKVLGAGGGGFMLFVVPPERQSAVRRSLARLPHIKFAVSPAGSRIIFYHPQERT